MNSRRAARTAVAALSLWVWVSAGGVDAQAVDCVGQWGVWGDCSVSCGLGGTAARTFYQVVVANGEGEECIADHLDTGTRACGTDDGPCPQDCAGAWSAWGPCSSSCLSGTRHRTFVIESEATFGGASCPLENGHVDLRTETCDCLPDCPADCEMDCSGYWGPWDDCSATECADSGLRGREFVVEQVAVLGGAACVAVDGDDDAEICTLNCQDGIPPNLAIGLGVGIAAAVVAIVAGVVVAVINKKRMRKLLSPRSTGGPDGGSTTRMFPRAVAYFGATGQEDDGLDDFVRLPAVVLDELRATQRKCANATSWQRVQKLLQLLQEYRQAVGKDAAETVFHEAATALIRDGNVTSVDNTDVEDGDLENGSVNGSYRRSGSVGTRASMRRGSSVDSSDDTGSGPTRVVRNCLLLIRQALEENTALMDNAVKCKDFRAVGRYNERAEQMTAMLPDSMATSAQEDHHLECVVPGLLLHRDRFEGSSEAFLGRGASAAVSEGVLVEVVGSTELRTVVAVKEVQKRGVESEQKAMREFLLLNKKLQPQHANIIRIFTIKSNSSTFFVVMEFCAFSLDKQPPEFQDFLHGTASETALSTNSAGGRRSVAITHVGRIILNALVQDLIRGASFLHLKQVAHCDIKPANVLCSFDRSGRRRDYKPKYFKEAQLKLTDFGVSRIIPNAASNSGGGETTATVSLAALVASEGIAGSESYMAPEILSIVRGLKGGTLTHEPDVSGELLFGTDAFACGCVIGFLCSRGKHPFSSTVFRNIPDNILAGRRIPLREMGIIDPRHLTLVDKMTTKDAKQRWNPQKCLNRSTIFESTQADATQILLNKIELHQQPEGSCRDQLLQPAMLERYPRLNKMISSTEQDSIDHTVRELEAKHQFLPVELDVDSLFAIVAYTFDNQVERTSNVYFALNNALRNREKDPAAFQLWQGFLFFLMRALGKLNKFKGLVYRGGNRGLHQKRVKRQYTLGRPIQWAAFSSTSQSEEASKAFVNKTEGVLFKLTVVSGTDIGPYSHIPTEGEVLLSPNTRFTVTRELYRDDEGYYCVDLAESKGLTLSS